MTQPRQRVEPIPQRPPLVGLLVTVPAVRLDDDHWGATGLAWDPERCEGGGVFNPCGTIDKSLDVADNEENLSFDPIGVWAGATCSTFDPEYARSEARARANRLLAACESKHLATEFWEGDVAQADGLDNFYLRQPGAAVLTDSDGVDAVPALACLEQSLAECSCSGVGLIHATRQVVTLWVENGLVDREGSVLSTRMGTLVIPDAGYTGGAPSGVTDLDGVSWAYATGQMRIYATTPRPVGSIPVQIVDRDVNTVAARTERAFGIVTEPCCHAAAGVQVVTCLNIESGS